jgi:hypothetical protein
LSLSRPAQASLTLPPARSHSRPRATFVTRLRPGRLPDRAARRLPDLSTTLWVDSSSTGDSRLRGALPIADIRPAIMGRAVSWSCPVPVNRNSPASCPWLSCSCQRPAGSAPSIQPRQAAQFSFARLPDRLHGWSKRHPRPQGNTIAIPQLAVDREQIVVEYPRTPARVSCLMIKRGKRAKARPPSKYFGPPLPPATGRCVCRGAARE